jgi:putative DNA primase/helicase
VAKELATLIAARRDVLLNGYTPVRVIVELGQTPYASELTTEAVRTYAFEICRCIKNKEDAPLPKDVAQLYLHGLEGQWHLRPLNGISTSPLLAADGSIRSANGYDEETGLWCHDVPDIVVPERPTKEEAQRALLVLRQAFQTFPFGDAVRFRDESLGVDVLDLAHQPQLDESTHLVALMTSVCRACLTLAPGFLYNASLISGAGTGKGLASKGVCLIGSGMRPSAMSAGHDNEELDKRLTAAAIEARPAIFLDNFNEGDLKSNTLASFLTENPARVRVLGQSKTVPLNTRTLVTITGNAVTISEDMARRILQIMLDAGMENPELRPFAPGFLEGIFARRSELLSACLTIWRWGVQHHALPRGKPIGSYEQWALWCRDPLLALGCRDPIDRIAVIKAADPRRRHLAEVFTKWWEHHTDQPVSAADLHLAVKEAIDPEARRGADGTLQFSRQKIAAFLRMHTNTRAGGFHLEEALPGTSAHRHQTTRHRLMKA